MHSEKMGELYGWTRERVPPLCKFLVHVPQSRRVSASLFFISDVAIGLLSLALSNFDEIFSSAFTAFEIVKKKTLLPIFGCSAFN